MEQFLIEYGACLVISGLGFLLVALSYFAASGGRSGVPLVGGILIAAGFLASPMKWLTVLALVDYGFWMFPVFYIREKRYTRRFESFFAEQAYAKGEYRPDKQLRIYIPEREEELTRSFQTRSVYELRVPPLLFAFVNDSSGRLFLLTEKRRKDGIEVTEFDGPSCTVTVPAKKSSMTVELTLTDRETP